MHLCRMPVERQQLLTGQRIPETDRVVTAAGGQCEAIGTESDAEHVTNMPWQERASLLLWHVPQSYFSVGLSRGQGLAVPREGQGENFVLCGPGGSKVAELPVPNSDGFVQALEYRVSPLGEKASAKTPVQYERPAALGARTWRPRSGAGSFRRRRRKPTFSRQAKMRPQKHDWCDPEVQ